MEDMNGVESTQSSMNESHKLLVRFIYPRKTSVSRSHCPTPPIHPLPLPAPKPLFRTPYKHRILTRLSFDSSSEGREMLLTGGSRCRMRLYGRGCEERTGGSGWLVDAVLDTVDGIATPNLPSPQTTLPPHPPIHPLQSLTNSQATLFPIKTYPAALLSALLLLLRLHRSNTPNTA